MLKSNAVTKGIEHATVNSKLCLEFGPYKWRVLDRQGDMVLLLSEDVLENCVYHSKFASVTWETSDLREYLNSNFLQSFTESEQRLIAEISIPNPKNPQYGTCGGNDTSDKVFLLSIEEARKYFSNDSDRRANGWWWLRSPGHSGGLAACVDGEGFINAFGYNAYDIHLCGPRPAIMLMQS